MNILQKTLRKIFPFYRNNLERKESDQFYKALINGLPENYASLKAQSKTTRLSSTSPWDLHPGFQFLGLAYPRETYKKHKRRGANFKLEGIEVYLKKEGKAFDLELLVKNNLPTGIKIGKKDFHLFEFDPTKINIKNIKETNFNFEPNETDIFLNNLPIKWKEKLIALDFDVVELNGKVYYTIYELEDGNYIAINKNLEVFSLIHDAKPMSKKMGIGIEEFLNKVENGSFDIEAHLDERYRKSR